ncbi:MAG: hypothetical protein GXO11_04470 [Epsilonproteobacteria bacterium]|nr:hypothetical protein [Campylobacterota bacterium]
MIEAVLSNDYTSLLRYQREVSIQPVNDPITVPEEEFRPEIPIETKMELQDKLQEKKDSYEEAQEQQEAKTREFIAGYAEIESKKTQFEILLEGMNPEDDVIDESESSLIDSLYTLRDIQKQNNTVKAYATYQEWQQNNAKSI